jgi:hypothetical protein
MECSGLAVAHHQPALHSKKECRDGQNGQNEKIDP